MDFRIDDSIQIDQSSNQRNTQLKIKCINNHPSNLACNNSNCKQYAFVCNEKQCECRIQHKKCLFTCTDQILQVIEQKQSESADILEKVCSVLDNWIDEISKTRQKIEQIMKDWGLSSVQKKFINLIKNEQYKELTGQHINQITTQSLQYFTEQTKERILSQIEETQKNYKSEIKYIMNTMTSLFDKYQIDEKDIAFKQQKEILIEVQYDFMADLENFKNTQLLKPFTKKDYDRLVTFLKEAFRKDFEVYMQKYRNSRRAYGTQKLRDKYFQQYFYALTRGEQHIKKWQSTINERTKQINKYFEGDWKELQIFYRQSDGVIDKPFTPEIALSLQRTINTIYLLVDFIRKNGKKMLRVLTERNKFLSQNFQLAIYFLDGLMDTHPEINEIEVIWNIIKFSQKVKNQVNFLYEVMEEAKKDSYQVQINIEKIV